MKRIIDYMTGRLIPGGGTRQPSGSGAVFIATPHKLITIEGLTCFRERDIVRLEFSIRNLGDEIRCFGLKLVNNFDRFGNEYEFRLRFGKTVSCDGSMIHYTLPRDIPIKVCVFLEGVNREAEHIAQVKFSGICIRNRHHNKKYNPSGILLLRNIPIESCEGNMPEDSRT